MFPLLQIALNQATRVTAGVVTNDVDLGVAEQAAAQVIEVAVDLGVRCPALVGPNSQALSCRTGLTVEKLRGWAVARRRASYADQWLPER